MKRYFLLASFIFTLIVAIPVVTPKTAYAAPPAAAGVIIANPTYMRVMINGVMTVIPIVARYTTQAGVRNLIGLSISVTSGAAAPALVPVVLGIAASIVIQLTIENSDVLIPLAMKGGQWVIAEGSQAGATLIQATYSGGKQLLMDANEVIGDIAEVSYDGAKWIAYCHTGTIAGTVVGGTAGAVGGSIAGGMIGASMATAACLGSIGLTATTWGASFMLSIGVCGSAIATGTAMGSTVGAVGGGAVGAVGGGALGHLADGEECRFAK